MNARAALRWLRLCVTFACCCVVQHAQAGHALLFPEGPVTLVRGTTVYRVDAPLAIEPGDLLSTDARTGAQIEYGEGAIAALAAGTRVAIDPTSGDSLALLSGWMKITRPNASSPGALTIDTAALHAILRDGSAVLRANGNATALFIESGSMVLSLPERADHAQVLTGEQYVERESGKPLDIGPRPSTAFIAALPVTFRDPLGSIAARAQSKEAAPANGRMASYTDIGDWLTAPLAIRGTFVARFRPLARAEPFRTQVRLNLRDLPEWRRVLCPPPALPRSRAHVPIQSSSSEEKS